MVLAHLLYALMVVVRPEALWLRLVWNTVVLLIYVAVVLWNERKLVAQAIGKLKHRKQ